MNQIDQAAETPQTSSPSGPKVLVVDDLRFNRLTIKKYLEDIPCQVVEAQSGEEGLRMMQTQSFALALVDVNMPGINGLLMVELMRNWEEKRRVPVIFHRAAAFDAKSIRRGYAAGAADYLFKPFDPEVVQTKVRVFLDLYLLRQEVEKLNALLELALEEKKLLTVC